ncbi:MAG TPA: DEAD/DEAH box helicase family protein [Candidatus Omnitrophota bacterium]|nr:DEAD/DEAH box helicase family protein [Candidatus Omnitrophota bacterium]
MEKEAKARIKINKLLEESGWRFFDTPEGKANVKLESNVRLEDLGENFEKTTQGFIDYLLLDESSFPICVLEAKSEEKDPLIGKEKARRYANSQNVRYIILSNGNIHYFWDKQLGNPTRISRFPPLQSFKSHKNFLPDTNKLIQEQVNDDYVVLTQNPLYKQDPRWKDEAQREAFIKETGLKFLRAYQLRAVQTIQSAVSKGKNRFLFEMATGTGKTLVAGAIIKLYLKTNNARRVLFLVDRLELETQALKAFKDYLKPDYFTVIFKENRDDWQKADIVITTVQSISHDNKYLKLFSPTDFDLVISDEAHRSISGNSRLIFEYFISAKLGLTATPKDYLKNIDEKKLAATDPRELEKRILFSTYKTFGCESGVPTFRYTLPDGVKDGYLVNPKAIDCRTEITTQLLSDKGYAVQVQTEEGQEDEIIYKQKDFERNFFSEKTNIEFVKTFMENAAKDPISGEIGKSIVFCVSRKHASKITDILNDFALKMFPGKYNSDFAVQITSDIGKSQQMSISFANNNLNGHTSFFPGYKSSKTRVCVTVGMMTTGYDCLDILNLCLMRPIFSPTDFVQIKGRGTRKFTFSYKERQFDKEEVVEKEKENFKLFDFFANCEYFEEKYPYDQVIKLPPTKKGTGGDGPPPPSPVVTEIDVPDPLKMMEVMSFEGDIMRVDRELYMNKFESKVKETYEKTPEFKEAVDSGNYEEMEQFIKAHVFNKPKEYFNLEAIRQGYHADRRLGLWEILDKIFGKIHRFKTKDEIAQEEFEKFLVDQGVPPEQYYEVREFFKSYLIDEAFRVAINQKEFNKFASNPVMMEIFRKLGREKIQNVSEYIKDNVILNIFS